MEGQVDLVQNWLSDPATVNFIGIQDLRSLGLDPLSDEKPQTTAQEIKDESLNVWKPQSEGPATQASSSASKGMGRNDLNHGYINKPDWLGATSFIPGIAGTAAKAVNAGIGINNQVAEKHAFQSMGLPAPSFKDSVKGTVKNDKGYLTDVRANDRNYAVGLEALTPSGRTTLTPNEARVRSGFAGVQDVGRAKEEDKATGIFSEARSFLSSLFSDDDEKDFEKDRNTPGRNYSPNDYPSRPQATATTTKDNVDMAGGFAGGEPPAGYDAVGTPTGNDAPWGGPR